MSDFRHHRASQPTVIFVPVPYEIGSPKEANRHHPPRYPSNQRQPWKPAQTIPTRRSKGGATLELMRRIAEQEAALRSMMRPRPASIADLLSARSFHNGQ